MGRSTVFGPSPAVADPARRRRSSSAGSGTPSRASSSRPGKMRGPALHSATVACVTAGASRLVPEHQRLHHPHAVRAGDQHSHDRRRRDRGTCRQQPKLRRLGAERALHNRSLDQRSIRWRIDQAPVPVGHFEHRRSHSMAFVRYHAESPSPGQWWWDRLDHVVRRDRERCACAHGECATRHAPLDRHGRGHLPDGVASMALVSASCRVWLGRSNRRDLQEPRLSRSSGTCRKPIASSCSRRVSGGAPRCCPPPWPACEPGMLWRCA